MSRPFVPVSSFITHLDQGWSPKCEPSARVSRDQWAVLKTTAVQPVAYDEIENKLLPAHLEPRPSIEVEAGDVLITRAGPRSRVGITCVVRATQPRLMLADKLYRLKVRKDVADPVWLAHMLNAPQSLELLEEMKTGISDSGLNLTQEKFLSLPLPLVSLDEQRRTASKLDSLRTRSTRVLHELDRIPKLIDRYKQAILAKAFSGELTADWRDAQGLELGAAVTLGSVAQDFSYGSSTKSSSEGRVPVLRMGNIQGGKLDWTDLVYTSDAAEIEKYRLQTGDVLFNRTNSPELVGKTALYGGDREAIYAGYLIRVRCGERLLPAYLTYCLNSPQGRDYCWRVKTDGVSQSNVNAKKLAAFELLLPTVEEQAEIVRRIDHAFAWLDKIATEHARAEHLLPKLDQAILAKAFRGELVPQDPSDEPASVLLGRIKAEREEGGQTRRRRARA